MDREAFTAMAINEISVEPFEFGKCDCCMFTKRVVEKVTGAKSASTFNYDSKHRADAIVNANGGMEALIHACYPDAVECDAAATLDGDPVLANIPKIGRLFGVRFQNGVVCKTHRGVFWLDMRFALKGWRVQCHRS